MMKTAEPGTGGHLRIRRWLTLHWPSVWRVLIQGIVNPVIVVVFHVIANQPPQMPFVQCDHVVQNLPPAASDPALCNPVLPGRLNTRALRLEAGCFEQGDHIRIELRVAVEDDMPIRTSLGKCFPQLLHNPRASQQ